MAPRIVLFGATGYTGDLTARELVRRGARPVLAARSAERLEALASELGDLETQVADVTRPESVRALVDEGDVLITTVGPFMRWGEPALEAALGARAHYLDSTGEPPFIRHVFEDAGPRAEATGVGLMTAMGYDYVPGNLAGALALRDGGEQATRVEVGYFWEGGTSAGMSGGTQASAAGVMLERGYRWRAGRLVSERAARRVRRFDVGAGRRAQAVSIGSSEHFALPRLGRNVWDVDVYLGWFGPASRAMQVAAAGTDVVVRVPGVKPGMHALLSRFVKGSTGGPDAAARAATRSVIVAEAFDAGGAQLSHVRLVGPNGYDLTAAFLAFGALQAAAGRLKAAGALGPVDGLGLDALEAAAADAGLVRG